MLSGFDHVYKQHQRSRSLAWRTVQPIQAPQYKNDMVRPHLDIVSGHNTAMEQLFTLRMLSLSLLGISWFAMNAMAFPAANIQDTAPQMVKFKSAVQSDVGLRFVQNSGVCETTPGVNQMSGYIDFGSDMSMVRISRVSCSVPS